MSSSAPEFGEVLEKLDGIIANVKEAGLAETVQLLKIARLDLALRVHNFSEEEFDVALYSLRKTLAVEDPGTKRKAHASRNATVRH